MQSLYDWIWIGNLRNDRIRLFAKSLKGMSIPKIWVQPGATEAMCMGPNRDFHWDIEQPRCY